MKSLTTFIYESAVKMNSSKLAEYKKLIDEYKKTAEEHGFTLFVDKADKSGTLWLSSENLDNLDYFAGAADGIFRGLGEEKWPLPYSGCDAHVLDDIYDVPVLYFCMWLNLGPCENPQEQYKTAKECYGVDADDPMYEMWTENDFDDPDKFLDALIGQVKDILTVFPQYKKYQED